MKDKRLAHWLESKEGVLVPSSEAMVELGQLLGQELPPNSVLCLFGDLGTGKTTLVKGVAAAAAQQPQSAVQSPTFNYMHLYEGQKPVYHFDLYRLHAPEEFYAMGFDESFTAGGICCLEWPERIAAALPQNRWEVHLFHVDLETRRALLKRKE